jgi:DNA-binding transcriptional ArsR family regulator
MPEHLQIRDQRPVEYFWADNELYDVYLEKIGVYGFAVYMALSRYTNRDAKSWPSVKTIADKLGISKPTVKRALRALEECGLIAVDRPSSDGLGHQQTNVYTLLAVKKIPRQPQNLGNDRPYPWQPQTLPMATTEPSLGSDVAPNKKQLTRNIKQGEGAAPATQDASPRPRTKKQKYEGILTTLPDVAQQAIKLYQATFGRYPNATQMELIAAQVTDLSQWEIVLREWAANDWNAAGIGKMIDRYQKGGAKRNSVSTGPAPYHANRPPPQTNGRDPVVPPIPRSEKEKLLARAKEHRHETSS